MPEIATLSRNTASLLAEHDPLLGKSQSHADDPRTARTW